tara:strand:- start:2204 stop:2680 length:477 start_codon:yes stop_codon:yes gene_type:complete
VTQTDIITEILQQHQGLEGPLLPILHATQDRLGYIPDDAIPQIAEALNISVAEVHGVISFYHVFRTTPPAANVLQYCRAEACQSMGSQQLESLLTERFDIDPQHGGQTDTLTLEPVYCMGNCARPPSVRLNGKLHSRVTTETLDSLLAQLPDTAETKA